MIALTSVSFRNCLIALETNQEVILYSPCWVSGCMQSLESSKSPSCSFLANPNAPCATSGTGSPVKIQTPTGPPIFKGEKSFFRNKP